MGEVLSKDNIHLTAGETVQSGLVRLILIKQGRQRRKEEGIKIQFSRKGKFTPSSSAAVAIE